MTESITLTWRRLLSLYLPLMASGLLMTLETPLITAGIARQARPELFLAAFGVAFVVALIYEAPVIMVLEASIALGYNRAAYERLRRAYLLLGVTLTAIGLLLFFTPVYRLITERLMGIPSTIADAARPALMILTFWPLPIGWRRLHQGVLIRAGHPAIISLATGIRLAILAAILFSGVFHDVPGAVLGAVAMVTGVTVEAVIVTPPALRVLADDGAPPTDWRATWRYYWPLASTTLLNTLNRPLITAGIAASSAAALSLAAWPVLQSVVSFTWGPISALQQVVIAVSEDAASRKRTASFVLAVGGVLTTVLCIVTFTPLIDVVLLRIFGVSSVLRDAIVTPARVLAMMPVITTVQAFFRGSLIRGGQTVAVQRAMLMSLVGVSMWVAIGWALGTLHGIWVGALATLTGAAADAVSLWWAMRVRYGAPAGAPVPVDASS